MDNNRNEKFSTVIVTSKGQSQASSFTIRTHHIKYFKGYLLVIGLLLCVLLITIVGLSFHIKEQYTKADTLKLQVVSLQNSFPVKNRIAASKDSMLTQTYISQLQNKLAKINDYLKARGVGGFSNLTVGGGVGGNKVSDANLKTHEKLALYSDYTTRLFNGLSLVPLGYPHHGGVSSSYGYRSDPFD